MFGNCFCKMMPGLGEFYFRCCMQSGHTLLFLITVFSSYHSGSHQHLHLHLNKSSRTTCLHIYTPPTANKGNVCGVLWWENELDEVFVGNIWASTVYQGQHGISISLSRKKRKRNKHLPGLQRNSSLQHLVLPALETPIWVKTLQSKSLPVKAVHGHLLNIISYVICTKHISKPNFLQSWWLHIWNFGHAYSGRIREALLENMVNHIIHILIWRWGHPLALASPHGGAECGGTTRVEKR